VSIDPKELDAQREALMSKLDEGRRKFFKRVGAGGIAAGGAAAGLMPLDALAGNGGGHGHGYTPYGGPWDQYFVLDRKSLFMNIGTTGSTPRRVLKNLAENNLLIARDPRENFSVQNMRNTIAHGFGADPNEIVMSFNTTDGMSRILNGIQWQPGDEIITTNMEHGGGNSPMQLQVDRRGVVLKRVNLPTGDAYSDELVLQRFQALVTGKTKAICFSSPPYLTGIRLPEKKLCLWAASLGLISIIDGAHGPGMLDLDFHDMGCDFYAGSGHKWQCGPGQTGIMYVRNNYTPSPYSKEVTLIDDTTATIQYPGYSNTTPLHPFFPTHGGYSGQPDTALAGGVRNPEHNVAATISSVGNPSYPALKALQECCSMWDHIGRDDIERYITNLAQYLRSRLTSIWGPRCLATPYDSRRPHHARIALTSFNPFSPGFDYNADLTPAMAEEQTTASGNAVTALREQENVVVRNNNVPHTLRSDPGQNAVASSPDGSTPLTSSHPLRISTHLFHDRKDVDRLVKALLATVPRP
jgi:selenocysteine lyase/cysteine desulfurase